MTIRKEGTAPIGEIPAGHKMWTSLELPLTIKDDARALFASNNIRVTWHSPDNAGIAKADVALSADWDVARAKWYGYLVQIAKNYCDRTGKKLSRWELELIEKARPKKVE